MAILLVGFSVVSLRAEAEEAARVQGLAVAQTQAAVVKDFVDAELASAGSVAAAISIVDMNGMNVEIARALLLTTIENSDKLLAVSAAWSGVDGPVSVGWSRSGNEFVADANQIAYGVEQPSSLPAAEQIEVEDPLFGQGTDSSLSSVLVVPIMRGAEAIGAVYFNLDLSFLQELANA